MKKLALPLTMFGALALLACSQDAKEAETDMPEFERSDEPASDVDLRQTGDGETTVEEDRESEAADSEPVPDKPSESETDEEPATPPGR